MIELIVGALISLLISTQEKHDYCVVEKPSENKEQVLVVKDKKYCSVFKYTYSDVEFKKAKLVEKK